MKTALIAVSALLVFSWVAPWTLAGLGYHVTGYSTWSTGEHAGAHGHTTHGPDSHHG